jgi:hypothetical protein
MPNYNKITAGFVIQEFDEQGTCIHQEFVAGDQVDYEMRDGETIPAPEPYFPFDMLQPEALGFVDVDYISSFDDGNIVLTTEAKYNPLTGQVEAIQVVNIEGTNYCDRDWVVYDGKEWDVCRNCFDYVLEKNANELQEDEEPQCRGNCCN